MKIKQHFMFTAVLLLCCALNINAEIFTGSCGPNVTYKIDTSSGLFEIMGTGEWTERILPASQVTSVSKQITTARIHEGVTCINSDAFSGCPNLISVSIANTVTRIEEEAFQDCSKLRSIVIPASVTSIDKSAFSDCIKLYEIYNLSNLEFTIGDRKNHGMIARYAKVIYKSLDEPSIYQTIGDFTFIELDGTVELVSYDGKSKDVVLPKDYRGRNYAIGSDAFRNSDITSVTIPEGVTSIGTSAFRNCNNLLSIVIPKNLKKIDSSAFSGCYKLYEVYDLSDDVVVTKSDTNNGYVGYYAEVIHTSLDEPSVYSKMGDYVFMNIDNPKLVQYNGTSNDLVLPDNYMGKQYEIGKDAFYNCSDIKSVKFSDNVTSIGSSAFEGCSGLTSVTIPNSVTSIGSSAFYNCSGLTSVTITNSVTSIESYAFCNCSGLASVVIGNNVSSIGNNAFIGCSELYEVYNLSDLNIQKGSSDYGYVGYYAKVIHKSLDEPSAYGSVGDFLFLDLETPQLISYKGNATDIILPEDFRGKSYEIGSSAFSYCSGLTSVTIPNSVTSIGISAFYGCSDLTSVTIPNSVTLIGSSAFEYCSGLTSVIIPNSVTSIGPYAFRGCSGLTTVVIGNSVSRIDFYAFSYCSNLKRLVSLNVTPSIIYYSTFDSNTFTSCELYVPAEAVEAYKAADCWKDFSVIKGIVKGDSDGDCMVTKKDADAIVQYYLGINHDVNPVAADVNGDGKVTMQDANMIINNLNNQPEDDGTITIVHKPNSKTMINGYEYNISSYNSCELDDIISNYISDNSKKEGQIFYLEGGKTYHFSNNCVIYKGFTLCTKPEDVANGKRATVCLSGMTRSYDNEDLINICNFMLGRQLGVSESPTDNLNIGTVRFVDIDFQVPMACNIGDQTDKKGNTCGNYFLNTFSDQIGVNLSLLEWDNCTFQGFIRGFFRVQGGNDIHISNIKLSNCQFYNNGYFNTTGSDFGYIWADMSGKPMSNIFENIEICNNVFYDNPKSALISDANRNIMWDSSVKWNIDIHHNTFVNWNTQSAQPIINTRYVPGGSKLSFHENLIILTRDERDVNRKLEDYSAGWDTRSIQGGDGSGHAYFIIHDNYSTNDHLTYGQVFYVNAFSASSNAPGKWVKGWKTEGTLYKYFPYGETSLVVTADDISATELMVDPNPKYFIGTVPSGKDHHTDTGIQGLFYQTTAKVKNSQIYRMKVGAPMLYK